VFFTARADANSGCGRFSNNKLSKAFIQRHEWLYEKTPIRYRRKGSLALSLPSFLYACTPGETSLYILQKELLLQFSGLDSLEMQKAFI